MFGKSWKLRRARDERMIKCFYDQVNYRCRTAAHRERISATAFRRPREGRFRESDILRQSLHGRPPYQRRAFAVDASLIAAEANSLGRSLGRPNLKRPVADERRQRLGNRALAPLPTSRRCREPYLTRLTTRPITAASPDVYDNAPTKTTMSPPSFSSRAIESSVHRAVNVSSARTARRN